MNRIPSGYSKITLVLLGVGMLCISGFYLPQQSARAQTPAPDSVSTEVEKIKKQIADRNNRLKAIEKEIAQYQGELQKVGSEKTTLQTAIQQLELERKKVQSDVSYTQNKIGATDLEIQKLDLEIQNTESHITLNRAAIAEMIRRLNEVDHTSFIETLLTTKNMSELWSAVDTLAQLRDAMSTKVQDLGELHTVLTEKVGEHQDKRSSLVALKDQFTGQQKVLEVNKIEKNQLLTQTKSKEANYQALLTQKKAAKEQFERELSELETKLQFTLDPKTIPANASGVLAWPVTPVVLTQRFGNTAFAQSGAYGGQGHNGIDFGIPTGTTIKAALSGSITGVGNTDVGGCSSYGKWALVRHDNGLSTLYAHLSVIQVSVGQRVATGETIGFSGSTGYATGPHLHFSVFASAGVSIKNLGEWYRQNGRAPTTACALAGVSIPVAAFSAYLDPTQYLPGR